MPKQVLVIPDTHFPYHDEKVWRCILQAIKQLRPHTAVHIGDVTDSYSVSRFAKDPSRKLEMKWELDEANVQFDRMDGFGCQKRLVLGNHDIRMEKAIKDQLPALSGMLTIAKELRLAQRGWKVTDYGDWLQIGEVAYTHDVGRYGAYAARQSLMDFGGNLVFGHTHRLAVAYQGQTDGTKHVCLNVGCAIDFDQVGYGYKSKALRDWQHGFGWVTYNSKGQGWCQAIPVIDGVAYVDGQRVKG